MPRVWALLPLRSAMSTAGYAAQPYPASYNTQQQQYVQPPVQYSVQYSQAQQAYYNAPYPSNVPPKSQSPPPELPAAPEVLDVTPQVASKSLQKLISFELNGAGFEAAEPQALQRLEVEVISCECSLPVHHAINNIRVCANVPFALVISKIFQVAHDAANLANRANPIMTDLILGCEDIGYDTVGLHRVDAATRKRKRGTL